jgi:hypothetical protein
MTVHTVAVKEPSALIKNPSFTHNMNRSVPLALMFAAVLCHPAVFISGAAGPTAASPSPSGVATFGQDPPLLVPPTARPRCTATPDSIVVEAALAVRNESVFAKLRGTACGINVVPGAPLPWTGAGPHLRHVRILSVADSGGLLVAATSSNSRGARHTLYDVAVAQHGDSFALTAARVDRELQLPVDPRSTASPTVDTVSDIVCAVHSVSASSLTTSLSVYKWSPPGPAVLLFRRDDVGFSACAVVPLTSCGGGDAFPCACAAVVVAGGNVSADGSSVFAVRVDPHGVAVLDVPLAAADVTVRLTETEALCLHVNAAGGAHCVGKATVGAHVDELMLAHRSGGGPLKLTVSSDGFSMLNVAIITVGVACVVYYASLRGAPSDFQL